jgi:hypothetical protein
MTDFLNRKVPVASVTGIFRFTPDNPDVVVYCGLLA